MRRFFGIAALASLGVLSVVDGPSGVVAGEFAGLREVNPPPAADPGRTLAIVGARLIDGNGGPAVPDSGEEQRAAALWKDSVPAPIRWIPKNRIPV